MHTKKKINVFLAYGEIRGRLILLKIDLAKFIHFEFKMLISYKFAYLPYLINL